MIYGVEYVILISRAMQHHGIKPFPAIWVDVKEGSDAAKESKKYKPIAEVQLKKVTKLCANSMSKCVRGRCVTCMIQYFIYL